jgi:transcriptional regulator with XRE-family HTH domain
MITRIREVRRARKMTLQDVADRCSPPTTPQTIGRLETGTRTVSVGWLNRIAKALGVEAADLVQLPEREDIPVAATVGPEGTHAPRRPGVVLPPSAGDEIWCSRLAPEAFSRAMNRDVLLPPPAGRCIFGRLIGREEGKLHILPLGTGQRQMVVTNAAWAAVATRLVRTL